MNAVQCDYCGKFAPNPASAPTRRMGQWKLPSTWWAVFADEGGVAEARVAQDGGEFCSRECTSNHFAKPKAP